MREEIRADISGFWLEQSVGEADTQELTRKEEHIFGEREASPGHVTWELLGDMHLDL